MRWFVGGWRKMASMAAVSARPFLMFQGKAEAAMLFYVSLFPDARIVDILRYDVAGPGAEGTIKMGTFSIGDQTIMCTDSVVQHDFCFTPAFPLFVQCASQEQISHLSDALADGGAILMPLADYWFARQFAWVTDRYGVSWQLNLP